MTQLTLDHNGFLMVGDYHETGKLYTRLFYGYPYSAYDHTVLVVGKQGGRTAIVPTQWKDIGPSQHVLRARKQTFLTIGGELHQDEQQAIAAGFHILHTTDDTGVYKRMGKIDSRVQPYIDANPWLREKPQQPDVGAMIGGDLLPLYLFGIALAHGTWMSKRVDDDETLFPLKITLPLTSSLFGKKDSVQAIFDRLHVLGYAHSVTYEHSSTFEYCQAVIHDGLLLLQYTILTGTTLSLANNTTSHYTRRVCSELLLPYCEEHGYTLPCRPVEIQVLPLD